MPQQKKYTTPEEKREANRLRSAAYRAAHKEEANERARIWSANNLERRRKNYHARREHHCAVARARAARHRATSKAPVCAEQPDSHTGDSISTPVRLPPTAALTHEAGP